MHKESILAQLVGEAGPEPRAGNLLGLENSASARAMLAKTGILIPKGGDRGRKVAANIGTGNRQILKLHTILQDYWGELQPVTQG